MLLESHTVSLYPLSNFTFHTIEKTLELPQTPPSNTIVQAFGHFLTIEGIFGSTGYIALNKPNV